MSHQTPSDHMKDIGQTGDTELTTSTQMIEPFRVAIPQAEVNHGGHFSGWEQPALFTDEMRKAFHSIRAR